MKEKYDGQKKNLRWALKPISLGAKGGKNKEREG